jgi:hypothetical protein
VPVLGELVDARWPEDGRFYSALVTAVPPTDGAAAGAGHFGVRFDDGVTVELPLSDLRRLVYTDSRALAMARRVGATWTPEQLLERGTQLLDALAALKQGRSAAAWPVKIDPRLTRGMGCSAPPPPRHRRLVATLFLDLPSRTDFPDYYMVIKHPIALNDLRVCSKSDAAVQAFPHG